VAEADELRRDPELAEINLAMGYRTSIDFCFAIRAMNPELYRRCMSFLRPFHKKIYLKENTSADGYLGSLLDLPHEWVVNIDEDAFLFDPDAFLELLEHMIAEQNDLCGMPDGAFCRPRNFHPLVLNPFFNIFHIPRIRRQMQAPEPASGSVEKLMQRVQQVLQKAPMPEYYSLDEAGFEPYYPFFLDLAAKDSRILNLHAETWSEDPGITWEGQKVAVATLLKNHRDKDFLIHCWYSREYNPKDPHSRYAAILNYALKKRYPRTWKARSLLKMY
jgi:hypothetical protein